MADDTRDSNAAPTTGSNGGATDTQPSVIPPRKKLPKGMVLGKDGKPCRACTSFADFKGITKSTKPSTTSTIEPTLDQPPSNCPPDVELLGRSTWTLLHSITASYPSSPTPVEQANATTFVSLLGKMYPCWVCAEDFQAYMVKNKVRAESRDAFGRWMCEAHNEVNRKLGKGEFDCARWEERWRTGWKDGSCD